MNPQYYLKAIYAGILAGLGVLYIALNDNQVTTQEWVHIAEITIAAGGAVYGIPNKARGKYEA